MIDTDKNVWLIEINKNPGIVESSSIVKLLVPRMLDDAFRLTVDKVFVPNYSTNNNSEENYKSPFPVPNYSDYENMFDFVDSIK